MSDTDSWIAHTNELVARSQADRAVSADARNRVEQLMDKCATTMMNHWNTVNAALTDRVRDYIEARNKLQTQLAKVNALNLPDCFVAYRQDISMAVRVMTSPLRL